MTRTDLEKRLFRCTEDHMVYLARGDGKKETYRPAP